MQMKKYKYRFCVYKNNICDGIIYVRSYKNLGEALQAKAGIQMRGGGCCDVVKKKFLLGENEPIVTSIRNNYRYGELDL